MANLAKIKENAGRIIDFLDVCNIYSGNVPPEVYLKFNISDRPDKRPLQKKIHMERFLPGF